MTITTLTALVRQQDNDRYLASLFAPADKRAALLAVAAFNVETAKIPHLVSEPMLGYIRLAWWREALDEIYTGQQPRFHEIMPALTDTIRRYRIPRELFNRLLEAREQEIDSAIESEEQLATYLNNNVSGLGLWAHIIEQPMDDRLHSLGVAWGLTDLLRRDEALVTSWLANAQKHLTHFEASTNTVPLWNAVHRILKTRVEWMQKQGGSHRAAPQKPLPSLRLTWALTKLMFLNK